MTCLVTGTAISPNGAALANGVLRFFRTPSEVVSVAGSVVFPTPVVAVTSETGAISVALTPGTYRIQEDVSGVAFTATVPDDLPTVDWAYLLTAAAIVAIPDVVQEVFDARDEAVAAAEAAAGGGGGNGVLYIIPTGDMASPHSAITAALAAYDRVMIPAGTWAVNSTLVIPSGKVLLGAPGCTITTTISAIISMTNCFETRLSGFKIIGPHAGTSHQIVLTDCTYCEVDLTFENGNSGLNLIRSDFCKISLVAREMRGNGIRLSGAQYNEIRLLEGRNISNFGIYVAKDGDRISTGNRLYTEKKCVPEFLTAHQTSVVATSAGPNGYWYPEANRIGLEGVGMTAGNDGNIFIGGVIADTNDNGISVSSSKNTGGNLLITNCDHDGLHLYGSQNSFAGVTSIGNRMSGAGIGSSSVPDAFAQGNTITALVATGNEMYGVNLSSQADGNVVSGSLVGNDLGEIGNSASGSNFVNGAGSSPIIDTGSWEEVTSAPGGVVSATQTLITLNLAPGSQVTQVNFTGGKRPIIVLRNYTNSNVTIVHNSSFLRLTRKTDLVLKQNQAIMLVKVSGDVWQEIGAEWSSGGGSSSGFNDFFGGESTQFVTDLTSGIFTPTLSLVALDSPTGGTLTGMIGPVSASENPVIFMRNKNSTSVTVQHSNSSLRLNGHTDRTLGLHEGIIFARISGNVWQEFGDGGSSAWGGITGTLSDQTDLQAALDAKQPLAAVLTSTTASFTTAQESKLAGIATAATANATDAALRDRATHTGTQAAATITGLATVATSGAFADLTGTPTTFAGYGITDDVEQPALVPLTLDWVANGFPTSSAALAANGHVQGFWAVPYDITITDVGINVTTAGSAGATAKVTIYSATGSNRPDAILAESPDMAVTSTGVKTVTLTVPLALTKGQVVWIGVRASAAVTVTSATGGNTPGMALMTTPTTTSRTSVSRSATYGSGTQSPWVWSNAEVSSTPVPLVFMEAQ